MTEFKDRLLIAIGADSVRSFGLKCGIGESTLRSYLQGSSPRLDKLLALTEAAGVEIKWLASGDGPMRLSDKITSNGQINHLEDPLIKDIKLWLREMTTDNPGWRTWFEMELLHKIPMFKEWREKNQLGDDDQNSATG